MRTIVVYYSMEGNTKLIAETISDTINCDILRIVPKKDYSSKGFLKFFWGGKSAIFKETPKLEDNDFNIDDYDLIIIGTPVWAGRISPAVRTFLMKYNLEGKKLAVFACHGGSGVSRCINQVKELQPGAEIISKIDFYNPRKTKVKEQVESAKSWSEKLACA